MRVWPGQPYPLGATWTGTEQGNNNAYARDNELSWTYWDLSLEQGGTQYALQGRTLPVFALNAERRERRSEDALAKRP